MEIIYLLLSLTIVLLILSVPVAVAAAIRRLKMICPRRVRSGGLFDDGFEDIVGRFSNVFELRRRWWLEETQNVQAEAIPPRRRRFFFDLFPVGMVVIDDEAEDVLIFRWFRTSVVDGRREDRLGVELFRRVKPVVDVCSTDCNWEESLLSPQHRNAKERVFEEGNEARDRPVTVVDWIGLFCSIRNGRIWASKISDDDDDRVIEMTGGGGFLVTLVIDFYRNDENDEESRVSTYTSAMLLIVDELQAYTRMGVFLSLSISLSVAINVDVAAVAACYWWWCEKRRVTTMLLMLVAPDATPQ